MEASLGCVCIKSSISKTCRYQQIIELSLFTIYFVCFILDKPICAMVSYIASSSFQSLFLLCIKHSERSGKTSLDDQ